MNQMSLGQLFAVQAAAHPDKIAVVDGPLGITYREAEGEAIRLAKRLLELPFKQEELVIILSPPGLDHIISQLAVVYAGGTCVPLDPKLSDAELQEKVDFLGATIILADASIAKRSIKTLHNIEHSTSCGSFEFETENHNDLPRPLLPEHRSHILFTSGTTGTPKGVQIPAKAVLPLRDEVYTSEDRFAFANNTVFDASIFDIWVPLTIGATVIVVDRKVLLDPDHFAQFLLEESITVILLTASLLAAIADVRPDAFRQCKTLITAGETPNANAVRAVFRNGPPQRLLNGYGPTEMGVFSTFHDITEQEALKGEFPLGSVINGVEMVLVDDHFNIVHGQGSGEAFLRGNGQSLGYYDDHLTTINAFVKIPGADDDVIFYRTGDIVQRDGQGRLFWRGRKKHEIKHHGWRVNLDTIESEVFKLPGVASVAATRLDDPHGGGGSWIVACVVPVPNRGPKFREECQRGIKTRLPHYMVPQIICMPSLPMNANGKVDRQRLPHHVFARRDSLDSLPGSDDLSETASKLRIIWQRSLGTISLREITADSDFLLLGANSLDVTAALSAMRLVFKISISAQVIYENPTLCACARAIDHLLLQTTVREGENLKASLISDTHLADDIQFPDTVVGDWRGADEGRVLLTGSTGFVGAFLLQALVDHAEVKEVRCLVRATAAEGARQRVLDNLSKYGLLQTLSADNLAKVRPIAGNLLEEKLGLDDASYRDLASWASVIFHVAAHVNYVQPYSAHRAVNVLGTLHVVQLAVAERLKPIHYASTVASLGPTGLCRPGTIREDDDIWPFLDIIPFEMGYGQSKWVAEMMLRRAMKKGLQATIYRLGFVVCERKNGVGNPDDFVSRFVADILALGAYPDLPDSRKELTTINHVVSTIMTVANFPESCGHTYHVVPDQRDIEDMTSNKFCEILAEVTATRLEKVPYPEWVTRVVNMDQKRPMRLRAVIPMLQEKVIVQRTRWEAYEGMGRFRTDNVREARARAGQTSRLADSGIQKDELARYFQFLGY